MIGLYKRKGVVLFFRDAITAHALTSIIDFGDDVLRHDVASTDNTDANGKRCLVPAGPAPHRGEHFRIIG